MSRYSYVLVKWYKRGATWEDGKPRICIRCRIEKRRGRRAIVTAIRKRRREGYAFRMPVEYCAEHLPDPLRKEAPSWVKL